MMGIKEDFKCGTTLYRLLDKELIADRLELVGRRRTRVYYHIEPKGLEYLDKLEKEYELTSAGIDAIMSYVPEDEEYLILR